MPSVVGGGTKTFGNGAALSNGPSVQYSATSCGVWTWTTRPFSADCGGCFFEAAMRISRLSGLRSESPFRVRHIACQLYTGRRTPFSPAPVPRRTIGVNHNAGSKNRGLDQTSTAFWFNAALDLRLRQSTAKETLEIGDTSCAVARRTDLSTDELRRLLRWTKSTPTTKVTRRRPSDCDF